MAPIKINIPSDFVRNMSQFMTNVQQMQQLVQKFNQQARQLPAAQSLFISHYATTNKFAHLLQVLRKTTASFQRGLDSIVNAMGTMGKWFLRGLTIAADVLGPIIAASVATVSFIGQAAMSLAFVSYRVMKWFWDKMVLLGDSMLQDWLTASGSLTTIGGLRAYRATFGTILNDPQVLMNTIQARGSQASRQFAALRSLGIYNLKDTTDLAVDATLAAMQFMRVQRTGTELAMANAFAITSLINPETLIRYKNFSVEELQSLRDMYKAYRPLLEVSEKARRGWMNFSLQIKAAWAQIQTVIAEKLVDKNSPLVQALTELSRVIVKFFKVLIDTSITQVIVDFLKYWIDQFANWMKSPDRKGQIEKLMSDIGDITNDLLKCIHLLGQIVDSFSGEPPEVPLRGGGRRALAQKLKIDYPVGVPIARYPGRARFVQRIGIAQPPGAPPPIARYPGRARFAERIGIAHPIPDIPGVPTAAPRVPTAAPRVPIRRPVAPKAPPPIVRGPSVAPKVSPAAPRGPGRQAPIEGIKPAAGELKGGHVNSSDLYNTLKKKFTGSKLDGFVPKDGARWGITKGTPDEWARLGTAVAKQESGLNANSSGGGLYQFEQGDLARYGVRGAVNDPNAQVDAMVNQWTSSIPKDGVISQPAPGNPGPGNSWLGAGRYFGSMRDQGWHGKTRADVDKYLGSNGWADRAQQAAQGTASTGGVPAATGPAPTGPGPSAPSGAMLAATGKPPEAFIVHHTGGRERSGEAVRDEVAARGLGVEYVMERDGTIKQIGGPGAKNIMPAGVYHGRSYTPFPEGDPRHGLTNKNIVGMEVIAKDDKDVTPAQVAAARAFIEKNYPNTPVFGHGEVNPGHKEEDEGRTIVQAIRKDREDKTTATTVPDHPQQTQAQDTPKWNSPDKSVWTKGTQPWGTENKKNDEKSTKPVVDNKEKTVTHHANDEDHPVNKVKVENHNTDVDVATVKHNHYTDHSEDADLVAAP